MHSAVDDRSRLAYSEIHDDEQAATAVAFWHRAQAFFASHGITVLAALTDNGACYRSRLWITELAAAGVTPRFIGPGDPRRTARSNGSTAPCSMNGPTPGTTAQNPRRRRQLDTWLHLYNHHRCHTALGGHPPVTRVNNLPGHYT